MNLKEKLDYVTGVFIFCNKSMSEMRILLETQDTDTEKKISLVILNYYFITLQICFALDYCKLFDAPNSNKPLKNIASIKSLINQYIQEQGLNEKIKHINSEFIALSTSAFTTAVRNLRNKKYAHVDGDWEHSPFGIKAFTLSQMNAMLSHVYKLGEIVRELNVLINDQDFIFDVPDIDDRTKIFIQQHAEYETFYWKKIDAELKGPGRNPGR